MDMLHAAATYRVKFNIVAKVLNIYVTKLDDAGAYNAHDAHSVQSLGHSGFDTPNDTIDQSK